MEETVISSLEKMLDYYMNYDNKLYEKNSKDSIVDHVGEAFDNWYQSNKPANTHFFAKV